MRHFVTLLILCLGGYFVWYYLNNREKVWTQIILKRHTFAVAVIVLALISFLLYQAANQSTRLI